MATDKPLPSPLTGELAPLTKGAPITYAMDNLVRMPAVAGGYVDLLMPSDSVLRQKGGTLDVYREVLRDDQVKSCFQQRRTAVTSAPWTVDPGDENDPRSVACALALADNLKRVGFDRITDRMLYALFYGFAVGEVMWTIRNGLVDVQDVRVRDRARFKFGVDRELYLYQPDGRVELMPDRKFWAMNTGADHDDEPYGMGLAHWLYWPVFFKRNGIKFWLIFLEKFGMPTAKATIAAGQMNNKEMVQRALAALRAIQTDGGVVVPEGVAIELIEIARSGAVDYESMYKAMDGAIAKTILSQTMTTDNGSSRAQATVHKTVADTVAQTDADLVSESFNRSVGAWFAELNFPGVAPPRVYRATQPPDDLAQRAERDVKVKALGFEPTEEYIIETYGPGWVKTQKALPPPGFPPPAGLAAPLPEEAESAQEFAELAAIAAVKNANRADQRALVEAAEAFGRQYDNIVGDRVRSILAYAEDSGDYETMRRHLNELAAEGAPRTATEKVRRATFMARMMGLFRGQR